MASEIEKLQAKIRRLEIWIFIFGFVAIVAVVSTALLLFSILSDNNQPIIINQTQTQNQQAEVESEFDTSNPKEAAEWLQQQYRKNASENAKAER